MPRPARCASSRIDVALVVGGRWHDVDFARLELLDLLAEHDAVRCTVHTTSPRSTCWRPPTPSSPTRATSGRSDEEAGRPARRGPRRARGCSALHATNSAIDPPVAGRTAAVPHPGRDAGVHRAARQPLPRAPEDRAGPHRRRAAVHPLVAGVPSFVTTDEVYVMALRDDLDVLLDTEFAGRVPRLRGLPLRSPHAPSGPLHPRRGRRPRRVLHARPLPGAVRRLRPRRRGPRRGGPRGVGLAGVPRGPAAVHGMGSARRQVAGMPGGGERMSSKGTAVVTGAGQGIGRAIAERLVADGYDVLALDVDAGTLADVGDGPRLPDCRRRRHRRCRRGGGGRPGAGLPGAGQQRRDPALPGPPAHHARRDAHRAGRQRHRPGADGAGARAGDGGQRRRRRHQPVVHHLARPRGGHLAVPGVEGGREPAHPGDGRGVRAPGRALQRGRAGHRPHGGHRRALRRRGRAGGDRGRAARSTGWGSPRTSRTPSASCAPTRPRGSPARPSSSTAATPPRTAPFFRWARKAPK